MPRAVTGYDDEIFATLSCGVHYKAFAKAGRMYQSFPRAHTRLGRSAIDRVLPKRCVPGIRRRSSYFGGWRTRPTRTLMADADSSFTHATDSLIALYRTVERRTLDQPLLSVMPILINFWEALKFCFFLIVNLFIIPVNFVILIRNFFQGHWKYRPFFCISFATSGSGSGAARPLWSPLYSFVRFSTPL